MPPMPDPAAADDVTAKIARLIEERGWNQEDFARIAGINRHTVRGLIQGKHRLRNATVQSAARALGLTVSELRSLPLDRLLPRMHAADGSADAGLKKLYAEATRPELIGWLERNEDRARGLSLIECDELLGMQSEAGPLARLGVEHVIGLMERRRDLVRKVMALAGTEYQAALEQIVELMYQRVQPPSR